VRLSEIRKELAGWAALIGKEVDPEVYVRVGNAKSLLTTMEVGELQSEGITIGAWAQPWEEQDLAVDDTGTAMVPADWE
jgi:hypothetical protein